MFRSSKSRNTETFCMYLNYGRKIYVDCINNLVIKGNFTCLYPPSVTITIFCILIQSNLHKTKP